MVSFSFQPEFAPLIESGQKIGTIRRTKRCNPGDKMHLYTGLRTKSCKLIGVKRCLESTPVFLMPNSISIGSAACVHSLKREDADLFAMRDGFLNYRAMHNWFVDQYYHEEFSGFLHRWA